MSSYATGFNHTWVGPVLLTPTPHYRCLFYDVCRSKVHHSYCCFSATLMQSGTYQTAREEQLSLNESGFIEQYYYIVSCMFWQKCCIAFIQGPKHGSYFQYSLTILMIYLSTLLHCLPMSSILNCLIHERVGNEEKFNTWFIIFPLFNELFTENH